MGEIQFPDMRDQLIVGFLDLSDADYQQHEWIKKWNGEPQYACYSFDGHIEFYADFLEDIGAFNFIEKKVAPYEWVGIVLKSKPEAEALYKVAEHILPLCHDCVTNIEYLSSPYLPQVRQAAAEAFNIFMANEQDNPEFCQRIEKIKQEHAALHARAQSQREAGPMDTEYCQDATTQTFSLTPRDKTLLNRAFRHWNIDDIITLLAKGGWNLDRRVLEAVPIDEIESRYSNIELTGGGANIKLEKDGPCSITERVALRFYMPHQALSIIQGNKNSQDPLQREDYVTIIKYKMNPNTHQMEAKSQEVKLKEWLQWKSWNEK